MLARLQQATTVVLLLAALAWGLLWLRAGLPSIALAGALLILFGYAVVLGVEIVLMRLVNRGDPDVPPATLGQTLRAWLGEVVTDLQVFAWRQPFRAGAVPDRLEPAPGRRGVVLVHGFVCNRGVWNPLLATLDAHRVPFMAVNLEPVFGSIDDYAIGIERAVRAVEAATGVPPVLVAHSMGGLAARAWLAAHGADHRVHRVITIGTPHRGTWLGRFGHTRNARQMRLGSEWQRELAAREPAARFAGFTCFWGHCDNIVFPASVATLPGADNRHLAGVAHLRMLFRPEVREAVLRAAGAGSPA